MGQNHVVLLKVSLLELCWAMESFVGSFAYKTLTETSLYVVEKSPVYDGQEI